MINKDQILFSNRSKLPDCEKPYQLERCKRFEDCESKLAGCRGCNIWNYLYDIDELKEWCEDHDKDFILMTMELRKELNNE